MVVLVVSKYFNSNFYEKIFNFTTKINSQDTDYYLFKEQLLLLSKANW